MHGGMKVYVGDPAAARAYVEADRGRADDYYLAEGTGFARRFTATDARVADLVPLTGDGYETWVAGRDPDTGQPRGRLRDDDRAVRFVEVVVNGPKTWSLAAALHPDIAAAYEAAQDRAAGQIIGWLSQHATTRVGPRGGQVQVPLEVLEAATVRHYTSRANDPHWHLHLQILSRVFAAGKWRGLHTVGVRDSLGAINGIGHAAMACDPELNAAFAAHGYTKDATGEIQELADYAGPFSARHAQIARNVDRYEAEWTATHPGERPGPALRRAWDARAWADGRPDKVTPQPGTNVAERWRTRVYDLGYRDPAGPVDLTPTPVGALDRDQLVQRTLARLAAGRSAWNAADVRGEVERLIAAAGVVAGAAMRFELAEDLTARAMDRCLPLLDRDGVPEHLRAWTSQLVLEVEADLTARLAARAATGGPDAGLTLPVGLPGGGARLDAGQSAAVAALSGDRPLAVVEGAAGAGKTTTLAATRALLHDQGRGMVVVTPTLKAAKVAAAEVGAAAGSAASLAYQHGWRWNADGAWTRLATGDTDPVTGRVYAGPTEAGARLRPGDLLVVDEAGMLDQDTARALLTVADECQVRVALLGDRHQLAAVGRGGVLDLAADAVDPAAHLTLEAVHRFTRSDAGLVLPDTEYADLTLAMRTGADPAAVFDALLARGQIRLHPDATALQDAIAAAAAGHHRRGESVAVVVNTREQAADLNAAIRDRLAADGRVDDQRVAITGAGQRIGVGDRIATRRNDRDLGVANRDIWTVTAVGRSGALLVTPAGPASGDVPGGVTPDPQGTRVLPADYVTAHVDLAYASTAHGVQGETVTATHLVVGERTGAASAYVGMTRGRTANTAHLVAANVDEAREQWVAVFARDRADLGPSHAAEQAAAEAARYAAPRPLEHVVADLHRAWTVEQNCLDRLAFWQPQRDQLREVVALEAPHAGELARLGAARERAAIAAQQAHQRAQASAAAVATEADRIRDRLLGSWDGERGAARAAAKVVLDGPGRLGLRRGAVARAGEQLADWADRWRAHVSSLPSDAKELARLAGWFDDRPALWAALDTSAQRAAEAAHPEHGAQGAAADAARQQHEQARSALAEAHGQRDQRLRGLEPAAWTPELEARLAELDRDIAATRQELTDARARIATLRAEHLAIPAAEPAQAQPAERLAHEHDAWRARRRNAERTARRAGDVRRTPNEWPVHVPPPPPPSSLGPRPGAGPRMGR
ncbi:conjugative relaxase domain-containing protein, TrwC/TraI family [Blastococcus aggregatus]|uniref:Conjugative relaxase domain-containing protein, TrwC/TraI family n=2 Tax=Blastococcus aggregatus TaxID=38502 RepID=A0A285V356_9ACTN|nr:conjugative relaxase domain-containing protein, TrwC/TraI family [Blastococcus aggregatus]